MKIILLLVSAILLVNSSTVEEKWQKFKINYGKQYRSLEEETKRLRTFKNNLLKIEEHNRKFELGEVSYKLGVNKFADLTEDEFKERLMIPQVHSELKADINVLEIKDNDVPDDIDWRRFGAVTRVKDQGECGGCWAFGAVGALEGQYFMKTGTLTTFSEQFLIDCSVGYNNGCRGGWTMNAYRFIRDDGLVTEEIYPYEGSDLPCRANGTLFKDMGFFAVKQDENEMKVAVAQHGPAAVAIDASTLYLYAGGVFDNPACSNTVTNHVVLLVGYGTTADGIDYWIVKNSWGADWGEDGYVKMSRNKNNQCAIASDVEYPII